MEVSLPAQDKIIQKRFLEHAQIEHVKKWTFRIILTVIILVSRPLVVYFVVVDYVIVVVVVFHFCVLPAWRQLFSTTCWCIFCVVSIKTSLQENTGKQAVQHCMLLADVTSALQQLLWSSGFLSNLLKDNTILNVSLIVVWLKVNIIYFIINLKFILIIFNFLK